MWHSGGVSGRRDPLEAAVARWGAAAYLTVLLCTEVLTMLVGVIAWRPDGSGAIGQLVVYVTGMVIGLFLWVRCPARPTAGGLLRWFLVLAVLMWILLLARELLTDGPLNPLSLAVPLLLALAWAKPPTPAEAAAVVTAVAGVFAAAVVVALILEVLGVAESWYVIRGFEAQREGDATAYWLPLAGPLGLEGRWAGPFPHPNMAGPVGGLLIVVGLCRRGWWRVILLVVGIAVLLLTASRTSTIGALLGSLAVLGAALLWDRRGSAGRWMALAGMPVLLAVMLGRGLVNDPSGGMVDSVDAAAAQASGASGRATIWPTYLDLWRESPWWGSPDARITSLVESGVLPRWAQHAHNLLLDTLARLGTLGGVVLLAVMAVAGLLTVRAAAARQQTGLGLLALILACALTETLVFWQLWAVSTIILFLAVLASVGPYPPARLRRAQPATPKATTTSAA